VTPGQERRASPRMPGEDAHRVVHVRVKPGIDVVVVDVSARGLLIETTRRLLPGSPLDLHFAERGGRTAALRGRVVRCSVSALLPGEVRYRGAVQFDRDQPGLARPPVEGTAGARTGNGTDSVRELDTRPEQAGTARRPDSAVDSRG